MKRILAHAGSARCRRIRRAGLGRRKGGCAAAPRCGSGRRQRVLPAAAEAAPAAAAAAAPLVANKGDNAWVMISAALVILMSIPGLALFYGGLVRTKNMLSVLMQVFVDLLADHRALGHLRLLGGLHRRQRVLRRARQALPEGRHA